MYDICRDMNASLKHHWDRNAVEAHSCVDADGEMSLDEQYTTVDKYSMGGCFNQKVFVNCLQASSSGKLHY